MMFKKIFIKLCNARGVAPTAVCNDIGLSAATFSCWTDESVPRKTTLYKLANYFNVSVDYLLGKEDAIPTDTTDFAVEDMLNLRRIPIYETVSAGLGATADDQPTEYIPLCFDSAYEADNTICIRVKGDSMAPVINNGDIVHVLKQDVVERGMMAVVLVDDEGFVKYLDYGTGWIELVSQNQMYRTMRFEGADTERVRVIGVVTGVTRRGTLHMNK
jgi:repressor LexA